MAARLFRTQKEWEAWLAKSFASSSGIWLRLAKKGAGLRTVSYSEALESALCYGWIDGQKKTFDEGSWLQRFSPRTPGSIWSRINRSRAIALTRAGRMKPPGLSAIETAKKNGRWSAAYDSHRTAAPPRDFQAALKKSPRAKAFFAGLNSQNRYAILFRIQTAKKIETRRMRIEKFIRMLSKHETLYP